MFSGKTPLKEAIPWGTCLPIRGNAGANIPKPLGSLYDTHLHYEAAGNSMEHGVLLGTKPELPQETVCTGTSQKVARICVPQSNPYKIPGSPNEYFLHA